MRTVLPELSGALREVCARTEPDFIQLGTALESLFENANRLSDRMVSAIRTIGEKTDDNPLSRLENYAKSTENMLSQRREEVEQKLHRVANIANLLDMLFGMCETVEKIALSLRVVGLNIGVESARSQTANEMFTVVVEKIKSLSETVVDLSRKIRGHAETARKSQISAHGRIHRDLRELRNLSREAQTALDQAMSEIRGIFSRGVSSIQKAGRRTESISEAVGEVVAAIQFHDSMNQRIQHIQQNFRDIENACNGTEANRSQKDGGSNSCDKMFSILLLQTGQIQQILTDLTEIRSGLEDAFIRIDSEIEGLAKLLSEFEAETGRRGADASRTVEKPMSNLSRAMVTLFSLLDKSEGLIKEVFDAANLVSDTIGRLTEYMDEIRRFSYDTHLMALNAIVKSGHLDEHGRTLEVLSQEMVRLSRDAAVFVGDVEDINQMILQSTSDLTQQHAQGPVEKKTARADVLTEIDETAESVAQISSAAFEEAESIRRTIDGIRTDLTFMDPLTETLTRVRASLNHLASIMGTTPDRPEGLTPQETMELAKRYTMQKERDVHRQITGEAFSSEPPDRVPSQNDGKTSKPPPEDLGENVELF